MGNNPNTITAEEIKALIVDAIQVMHKGEFSDYQVLQIRDIIRGEVVQFLTKQHECSKTVDKLSLTVYGSDGKNGLSGDMKFIKKIVPVWLGALTAVNIIAWFIVHFIS